MDLLTSCDVRDLTLPSVCLLLLYTPPGVCMNDGPEGGLWKRG